MSRAVTPAATILVLVLAACTNSPNADTQDASSRTPAATGSPTSIKVTPDTAISVDVPGVGTLTGPKGSVTKSGTMKVTAVSEAPALPSGVTVAGPGLDVAFAGTQLAKPLTITFGKVAASGGNVAVVLHQRADGTWEYKKATTVGGHVQVATKDFSINLPGFINPAAWADGLWQHIKSGAAGRTSPLTCTGEPNWLLWSNPSDQVHVCATTNAGRAELQVKSNRGVTLEIHRPGSPQYMWVQDQPNWLRHALGAAFGYDPDSTVLLPAGDTMTVGYARPATTQDLGFTVTGRTTRAWAHTVLQDALTYVVGWAVGKDARAFEAYMFVECDTGISTSSYHFDPGSLVDFLICVGSRVEEAAKNPSVVTAFALRFGGSSADIKELRGVINDAKSQFRIVGLIAPALQLGYGSALDGIQNLMTQGSSDTFSATLTGSGPTKSTTGGGPLPEVHATTSDGQLQLSVAHFPLGTTYYFCHSGSGFPTGGAVPKKGSIQVSSPTQSFPGVCSGSGNFWVGLQATDGRDYYSNQVTMTQPAGPSTPAVHATSNSGQMLVQLEGFPLGTTYWFCHFGSGWPTGGTVPKHGSVSVTTPNQTLGPLCSGTGNYWIGFQAPDGHDYYSNQVTLSAPTPSISVSSSGAQMQMQLRNFPLGTSYYFCHSGAGWPTGGAVPNHGAINVTSPGQFFAGLCAGSGNFWIGIQATDGHDYYSNQVILG